MNVDFTTPDQKRALWFGWRYWEKRTPEGQQFVLDMIDSANRLRRMLGLPISEDPDVSQWEDDGGAPLSEAA